MGVPRRRHAAHLEIPQRRRRVYLLASRSENPEEYLFGEDAGEPDKEHHAGRACGFYWTEGLRGLGWAVDAVPTLKGGSTIGIPSPPAIWMPDGRIVTPDIRDAEQLQGFDPDWTKPAEASSALVTVGSWLETQSRLTQRTGSVRNLLARRASRFRFRFLWMSKGLGR